MAVVYLVDVQGPKGEKIFIPTPEFLPRKGDVIMAPGTKLGDDSYDVLNVSHFIFPSETNIAIFCRKRKSHILSFPISQ